MNWIEVGDARLALGDCLEAMATLEPQSIDAILTDLPYQVTALKWDVIIPFAPMWAAVKRVLKPRGVFVTTASQPFTSALVMSNLEWFRYEWIWDKDRPSGFVNANRRPLVLHENVLIFCDGQTTYNPQKTIGKPSAPGWCKTKSGSSQPALAAIHKKYDEMKFPKSIIYEKKNGPSTYVHPTQKPVALLEYLVRTYTNEGDTVLDFCFGSCTTGVAAMNTGRRFIGVEKDEDYFNIGVKRITEAQQQLRLPLGGAREIRRSRGLIKAP